MSEPDTSTGVSSNSWVDVGMNAVKGLPWGKITAPMIPVAAGEWYFGGWLADLYKFNVEHSVIGQFPASEHFTTYMVSFMVTIAVYLALSVYHMSENVKTIK